MRTAIVYASVHHGNTEKLVKRIADECQFSLIDAVKQPNADLSSYDMIGFASEIYFSKFHQSLLYRTLRRLKRCLKRHGRSYLETVTLGLPWRE